MRRLRPIKINAHPDLYANIETVRKHFREKNGIELSQQEITGLMAKRIDLPAIKRIDLIGGSYAFKKAR